MKCRCLSIVTSLVLLLSTVGQGMGQSQPKAAPVFTLERVIQVARFGALSESNYVCQQLHQAMVMDAELDDWGDVEPIQLGDSSSDISAKVYLGWDLDNLYIACDVTDDVLDQNQELAEVKYGDHILLNFDLRSDGATPPRIDDQDYFMALSTEHGALIRRSNKMKELLDNAEIAATLKEDGSGYILEAVLPGEILQLFAPLAQRSFGFRITVVDFDGERDGQWVSTCGSDEAADWGKLLFVPMSDGVDEFAGQIFVSRAPLDRDGPLKAELAVLSPYPLYDAELQVQLTGTAGTLESVITNLELSESLNRFRMTWDTHSLAAGDLVIQIGIASEGQQVLSLSSRRLTKQIRKPVSGDITRPLPLEAKLKQLDSYTEKYAVDNVIQRIQETPYDAEKGFRFVVFGDNKGNVPLFSSVAESIYAEEPLFVVGVGDFVRNGNVQEFLKFVEIYEELVDYDLLPVMGNHDMGHKKKEFMYLFGKLDYSFDYGGCRFLILDNAEGKLTKEQLAWADGKLEESHSLRKFVFMHEPPKTIGKWAWHSFDKGADEFVELMEKYQVDEVFMGHIHAYSTDEYNGVNYTVTGGGGTSLNKKYGPKGNIHHYMVVDVSEHDIQQQVAQLNYSFVKGPAGNPFSTETTISDIKIPGSIELVERGSAGWRYLAHLPALDYWFAHEYDDTEWSEGEAPFGYGEKGIETKLDKGRDYCFRRYFDIQDDSQLESVVVRIASDDAAMVYLNGVLVEEDPAWDISSGHEFAYWNRQVVLKPEAVWQGRNVIAVILRNHELSSDSYLDMEILLTQE